MYLSEGAAEPLHFGVSNIQVMPGIKSIRTRARTCGRTPALALVGSLPDGNRWIVVALVPDRGEGAPDAVARWVPPPPTARHRPSESVRCLIVNFTVFAPPPPPPSLHHLLRVHYQS